MDIHIWYTLLSALVGGVMGARDRLGEVYLFFQVLALFVDPNAIDYAYISYEMQTKLPF
jgi:hypothetical protein